MYSKASRYTASRSADLGDTRFLIGSQNTWDTRFLAKSLEDTRFLLGSKPLEIHGFGQKPWRCTVFSSDVLDSKRVRKSLRNNLGCSIKSIRALLPRQYCKKRGFESLSLSYKHAQLYTMQRELNCLFFSVLWYSCFITSFPVLQRPLLF